MNVWETLNLLRYYYFSSGKVASQLNYNKAWTLWVLGSIDTYDLLDTILTFMKVIFSVVTTIFNNLLDS